MAGGQGLLKVRPGAAHAGPAGEPQSRPNHSRRRVHRPWISAAMLAAWLALEPGIPAHAMPAPAASDASWCGTIAEPESTGAGARSTRSVAGPCPPRGDCDDPAVRDSTRVVPIRLRLVAHILRSSDRSCDLSPEAVRVAVDHLNEVYAAIGTGFQFELRAVRVHDDDALAWVPPCDSADGCVRARRAINLARFLYAESPETQCNLVVTCLEQTGWGGISGIGTMPWSSSALRPQGGIWLNALTLEYKPHLLPHEMGHTLGLWHTFRGHDEVSGCADPCAERVDSPDRDRVGDFAADTPPTPVTYYCDAPPYGDCTGQPWGETQPENYMNYDPPECVRLFTPQQVSRMQCWTAARLMGWATSTPEGPMRLAVHLAPSPARSSLDLAFTLASDARVEVGVFDLLGRRIAIPFQGDLAPGSHRVHWDGRTRAGSRPPPGVYQVQVRASGAAGHAKFVWNP